MKKIRKVIKIFLLVFLISTVGILFFSKINHEIRKCAEKKELGKAIQGQYVMTKECKIFLRILGKKDADKTIVYMHGLGNSDAIVSTEPMFREFGADYKVVVMDRPGNGLSKDTGKEQCIESIIQTYREALGNAGQKAPYILIAHSISGIYATYWAQHYPDEIKAVIYLDADPAENYVRHKDEIEESMIASKIEHLVAESGLQRLIGSRDNLIGENYNQTYTEKEESERLLLMYQNTYSRAASSEMQNVCANAEKVMSGPAISQIPKLYISVSKVSGQYYNEIYQADLQKRFAADENKVQDYVREQNRIIDEKKKEMLKYGNITIVGLSGPHCIYEYAPAEVADTILHFLDHN